MTIRIERLPGNPIIRPGMDARMGDNINGPSLVRAPSWIDRTLGRYYLYFAHHDGRYMRLAFADDLAGPWRMFEPGVLPLQRSGFKGHIASPDVHLDEERREVRMYFHGADAPSAMDWTEQCTRVARSGDGLNFEVLPEVLGEPYFRVFRWREQHYALAMPGVFYRSEDGVSNFQRGPTLFTPDMRHSAVRVKGGQANRADRGERLQVFYTNAGDNPERILHATVDLTARWEQWRASEPEVVLEPEEEWEGARLPLAPSARGQSDVPVRQLRDPGIFEQDGRTWLLYTVAGERGIAIAEFRE